MTTVTSVGAAGAPPVTAGTPSGQQGSRGRAPPARRSSPGWACWSSSSSWPSSGRWWRPMTRRRASPPRTACRSRPRRRTCSAPPRPSRTCCPSCSSGAAADAGGDPGRRGRDRAVDPHRGDLRVRRRPRRRPAVPADQRRAGAARPAPADRDDRFPAEGPRPERPADRADHRGHRMGVGRPGAPGADAVDAEPGLRQVGAHHRRARAGGSSVSRSCPAWYRSSPPRSCSPSSTASAPTRRWRSSA